MKTGFGISEYTIREGKISLLGQMHERITTEINDPIYATAMLIESNFVHTLWISVDALGLTPETSQECYEAAKSIIPDLKEEEFIISATHIHTGPSFESYNSLTATDIEPKDIIQSSKWRSRLANAVRKATLQAKSTLEESYMEIAAARIQTGVCRRVEYSDGRSIIYGKTSETNFLKMEGRDGGPTLLIYVYSSKGVLKAVVADVPCTAQCDEMANYVSADYWGVVRNIVKKDLGEAVTVFPLCRSAGDLSPHHIADRFPQKPVEGITGGRRKAMEIGERIAHEIVYCKEKTVKKYEGNVPHAQTMKEIVLPAHNITKEEYEWAKDFLKKYKTDESYIGDMSKYCTGNRRFNYLNSHYKIRKYEQGEREIKTRIYATLIGDMVFITNPFELFIEYADRIRMALNKNIVFDIQLTYDRLGYLPTKRAAKGGSYSAFTFNCACPVSVGEIIVKESIELVQSLTAEIDF